MLEFTHSDCEIQNSEKKISEVVTFFWAQLFTQEQNSFYFNNLLTLNKLKAPMRQALHLHGSWSLLFVFVGGAMEPSRFFPHLCEMFHSSGPFLHIDGYIMCWQIMDILQFLIVFVVSVNDTSFWLMTFRPF